jgi:hypothetical protein
MNSSLRNTLFAFLVNAACLVAFMPFAASAAQAASLTGSGSSATEARPVGEFQAISLRGSIDAEVRQGPTAVSVTADDNLLPHLETVVEDGTLQVRWKSGTSLRTRGKVQVNISTPRLTSAASSGSGDVRIDGFDTPSLKLALSGSGDAQLRALTTDELTVTISGSSDVKGSGKARKVSIGIAGSGNVRLGDLKADDVKVSIAGSGDAEVNAAKALEVKIAGSGDVLYSGDAALTSRVAGSGTIRKR